jgi:NADH:ubiquinone oxidoreductase subunit 6 (subunit J)
MAEVVQIKGAGSTAKVRSPVAVALLPLITLGIYSLVWYYKINREMADLGKATGRTDELGDSPGKSLLAITLGAIVIVPAVISMINTFKRVQALQRTTGAEPLNGWLGLVLYLVISPVYYAYVQSGLNKAWQAQAGTAALDAAPAGVVAESTSPVAP